MRKVHIEYQRFIQLHDEFEAGMNKDAKKIEQEISEMLAAEIAADLKRAYERIINNWYASYSPQFYNRKNTMKDAFEVTLNGTEVSVYAMSDPMSGHRFDNDKLFKLTMQQGYHGGGWHNGAPMYRGPVPAYVVWTRPAERSFSPIRAMRGYIESYHYRPTTNLTKKFRAIVEKYASKYEYYNLFYRG